MSNKTSKQDYIYFKQCVIKYQKQLGLTDWKTYFEHETVEDSLAWIRLDWEGKCCTIGLSVDWSHHPVSKQTVHDSARHEVLHMLLADLVAVGKYRQSTDTDFTASQHAIIRRLENAWN